jgi:putative transposase
MTNTAKKILVLEEGEIVKYGGQEYVITKIADLDRVLGKNLDTGKTEMLRVWELSPSTPADEAARPDPALELQDVSEKDWAYARECLEIIKPLLGRRQRGSNLADEIAAKSGVSRPTLYRWMRYYRNTGLLSSLLPVKKNGGRGKGRLNKDIEAVIESVITGYYLTDQQPSIIDTAEKIRRQCMQAGLDLPHEHTIRKRISWIEEREKVFHRKGRMAAIMKFEPNEGSPKDAHWPLAVVQIDHTKVNVIVVDDTLRKPIGRAWITLLIDLYSRMIMGMHLTLDAPSAMSAGMAVSHAILPKEKWLEELGIKNADWPCWGVMGCLHMDNAKEFRGDMLKVACNEYGIDLELRPVKNPNYGGHIEKMMGTISKEFNKLPGATFSNPKQRGEYDSEGRACMTMKELEEWIVLFVAEYHHRLHSELGMSPLQKYREGLLGGNGRPPRGLPARRIDEEKIRLDFMPFVERTIQAYGVVVDEIHYFADVLRPWVGAADQDNPRASRVFRFRRDPRDISQLYFLDPITMQYYAIPYRDVSLRPLSLEQLKEARRAAKEAGHTQIDERIIFEFADRKEALAKESAKKTKAARMQQQKQLNHEKARKVKAKQLPKTAATAKPAMPPKSSSYNPSPNDYFDEDE